MDSFLIIITGSVVAITCGLLGNYLLLKKSSLLSDAISHAVLPGIVIAYMFSGDRSSILLLIGAAISGVLATFLIEIFQKKFKLQTDASIGIIYTALFALGIILISEQGQNIELDQECVLYGHIENVPLELIISDGFNFGPRPLWITGVNLLIVLTFIIVGYKGLKITTFNPEHAISLGISATIWHYSLMSLVSLTTVVSFEIVGAILVVGFMIILPAAAYLVTRKLKNMLIITAILGLLSSMGGFWLGRYLNCSIAGAMVACSGIFLAIAFVYSRMNFKSK